MQHRFVEIIPDAVEDDVLYISLKYCTAIHKCVCGCGNEVVTPISPTDWKLIFDGKTVSLSPSIGNWSFNCQSHYWIKRNKIVYAREWDKEEIQFGRTNDEKRKAKYYNKENESVSSVTKRPKKKKRWKKFLKSIFSF
ncbi:MAG: hypothetical protein BWY08_01544 [Bacteroidetes bacterium ADurb.Bin174]|nr:MAG: hypothetical protein BWY08_01544 [Bacteroidetes bacterium ADurb.Bin174]